MATFVFVTVPLMHARSDWATRFTAKSENTYKPPGIRKAVFIFICSSKLTCIGVLNPNRNS